MRRLYATIISLIAVTALCAFTGCGDGRALEQAQAAEKKGSYHKAYDQYCRIARKHPGSGNVAAAIRRIRPKAATFWAEHAQQAADAGRYDDAWRMWMRVLNIEPTHKDAITHIRQLERNHFLAIREAKAEYLERGAATLAVSVPDEPETQLTTKTETPPPAKIATTPQREPARIASVPVSARPSQDETTQTTPQETQVAMAQPSSLIPESSAETSVKHIAPTRPRSAPRIVTPTRPLPRIATRPIVPQPTAKEPAPRMANAQPVPEADPLVTKPISEAPSKVATETDRAAPADTQLEEKNAPIVPPSLTRTAPPPETADPAHMDETEHATIAAAPSKDEPATEPKPAPLPRIATTADQKQALATSSANVQPEPLPENGNGEQHGFGTFLVLRTLSRKDKQFPKFARLIDGVDAKLKDTDGDLDADINLYIGNKRIKKIRELGVDRPVVFRGESGKRYKLLILGIRHSTHTVRLGIKPV